MSVTLASADKVVLPSDQEASGRSFDDAELALVAEALRSGTLTSTKGTMVARFEKAVAELIGTSHAVACASGSAAVHAAVAVVDPEPGEEIVTTSITDMGALAPIVYEGAVPVFADTDPISGNVTAETIAAALSDRTRAIIVTHLFGNPVDLAGITAVAAKAGVPVIEDSAQAYLAATPLGLVGSVGEYGAFSLQQGKHSTCGEGGFVTTNDADLAHAVRTYVNKSWPYGRPNPDHRSLALNYRLTELQGAVALGQLPKLPGNVAHRREIAALLDKALTEVEGITPTVAAPGDEHAYWRYVVHVDREVVPGGPDAIAAALRPLGIPSAPRYIAKPAFRCAVFADQKTFGESRWPFSIARPEAVDYSAQRFPGTFAFLDSVLVLSFNERYTPEHAAFVADGLRTAVEQARSAA
ncbi:MAG: DegT/DnrJ/EryC1/StrS family aminotransferase [Pseudonocardia sp.]